MTTTIAPPAVARRPRTLPRTTVVVGLAAAAATTVVAALAHAAGVPLTVDGEMIPIAGFAQMTLLGAVLGGVLAAVLDRRPGPARTRFVQIALTLTALSCIPSVAMPPDVATKLTLVGTHLLAAAIIVGVLARRVHD